MLQARLSVIATAAACALTATPLQAQPVPFNCPAPPPTSAPDCGNPEFLSCGIDVDGTRRHFCIHKPFRPLQELPVVWGFHGRTGDGGVMVGHLADQTEQGMVLVAASALRSGAGCVPAWRHLGRDVRPDWNALANQTDDCVPPQPTPEHTDANDADLRFVQVLLDEIDAQIEPAGHYALGFSNGAGMIYQLMITNPLSPRFQGFAALAAGANEEKIRAANTGGSAGPWSAAGDIAHPILGMQGTADRVFVPVARMLDRTNELITAADAGEPALQGTSCDMGGNITVAGVFRCWGEFPMRQGLPGNTYIDQGERTLRWLLKRNRPQRRAIEGVYPDLGHGRDTLPAQEDATVTVRREWPARRARGSQPVVWINVIGAAHTLPGARGAYPPCGSNNCDIDIIREVLQFWRANAGLRSQWR